MPHGGLFMVAVIGLILCLYAFVFRKETLQHFSRPMRNIFMGYFILSSVVVAWGIIAFIASGFSA
jgi:hypothetical protein